MSDYDELNARLARDAQRNYGIRRWEWFLLGTLALGAVVLVGVAVFLAVTGELPQH